MNEEEPKLLRKVRVKTISQDIYDFEVPVDVQNMYSFQDDYCCIQAGDFVEIRSSCRSIEIDLSRKDGSRYLDNWRVK
jgi:hypothetical protein